MTTHPSPILSREQKGSHILSMHLIYLLFISVTTVPPCSRQNVLVSQSVSVEYYDTCSPTSDLQSEGTSEWLVIPSARFQKVANRKVVSLKSYRASVKRYRIRHYPQKLIPRLVVTLRYEYFSVQSVNSHCTCQIE